MKHQTGYSTMAETFQYEMKMMVRNGISKTLNLIWNDPRLYWFFTLSQVSGWNAYLSAKQFSIGKFRNFPGGQEEGIK